MSANCPSSHQGQLASKMERGNKNIKICKCGRYYIARYSKHTGYQIVEWNKPCCTVCIKALSKVEIERLEKEKAESDYRLEQFKLDGRVRNVWKKD